MARQRNDGRGRLGGRAKGTPNKPSTPVQEWLDKMLNGNRTIIEKGLSNATGDNAAIIYAALSLASAIRENTEALKATAALRSKMEQI